MSGSRTGRVAATLATIVIATAGCGGDEPSKDAESGSETSESPVSAVDAESFRSCILNGPVQVGSYDPMDTSATEVTQVASDNDATLVTAAKADDGLAYFFVPSDPAAAETMQGDVQEGLTALQAQLSEQAPKGMVLGEASAETVGQVVVGLIPFSAKKQDEMRSEAAADAEYCAEYRTS